MEKFLRKFIAIEKAGLFLPAFMYCLAAAGQSPVILSFSPAAGTIGSAVIISGSNFNPTAANNIVYFGGEQAKVTGVAANSLTVTVPDGATPGPITVTTNGLTAYSSKSFVTTFPGGSANFLSASLVASQTITAGLHPNSVAIADLDGDGMPDLAAAITANSPLSSIYVGRNKGSMSFDVGLSLSVPTGSSVYFLAIGDIDGDGKQDLVFTSIPGNILSVYRNTSTPDSLSFSARTDYNTGADPFSIAIGDLDDDGKPDLAVANFLSNTVSVFKNSSTPGNIALRPKTDLATGLAPHGVVIGDLDGDGKPDLAVANTFSRTVSLFRNESSMGSIGFSSPVNVGTGTDELYGIAMGDLDGDGKPDLVVTNDNFNMVTVATVACSILKNNSSPGTFSFAAPLNLGTGNAYSPAVGDMNGDGRPDLIIPLAVNGTLVYANRSMAGNILFGLPGTYNAPSAYSAAIGDLDGDQLPDMVAGNLLSNTLSVFKSSVTSVVISRFFPEVTLPGASDTIIGANFTGATAVTFGAQTAASFTVVSDTCIIAVVGSGQSGNVAVTTPKGTALGMDNFFVLAGAPTISSFYPTEFLSAGDAVTIYGSNFFGTTAVSFGGIPARSVTVNDETRITAIVDTGATGNIKVTAVSGVAEFPGFIYKGPTISSVSPTSGTAGTTITIKGNYFFSIGSVTFGGVPAASFTIVNSSTLSAVVGGGASGNITISSASGMSNYGGFIYTAPTITSVTPSFGGMGTKVILKGTNFTGASVVSIGGVAVASFTVVDSATVEAVVGAGASGSVTIVTPTGTGTIPGFIFSNNPSVSSFTPSTGKVGTSVTITGANFDTDPTKNLVFFGAVKVPVSSATANALVATVPSGTTFEPVTVLSGGKIAASSTAFNVTFDGAGPVIAPNSFDGPLDFTVNANPEGIIICDFDGDGKADVVSGGENNVTILRNTSVNGFLSFAPKINIPANLQPEHMTTGDIDGDGRPDLVVADHTGTGPGQPRLTIYRNISTPGVIAFAPAINLAIGNGTRVCLRDMDGDGKLDLVALEANTNGYFSISRNISSGNAIAFDTPVPFSVFANPAAEMAVVDMDGDGLPDMVLLTGPNVTIIKNTSTPGSISMQLPGIDLPSGSVPIDFAVADLDGDGRPDVAIADAGEATGGGENILIYPNSSSRGGMSFGNPVLVRVPANYLSWRVTVNDMDGDGKPDLVATNNITPSLSSVSIYKNASTPGNFSFGSHVDFSTGHLPWLSQTGDLDGDGKPEIIVSNNNGYDTMANTLTVLKNRTGALSATPSILINGQPVICQGDSVVLLSSSAINNQWYKDGQAIEGATNATLSVNEAGAYTVATSFPGTVSPLSAADTIAVKLAPAKPTITTNSARGLISSADSGNQWYMDTIFAISGATAQFYKPVDSGYYAVQVTAAGCASPFSDIAFYHLPRSIDTTSTGDGRAIAAPNPVVTGLPQVIYHFPGVGSLDGEVSDMFGKIILVQLNIRSGDYLNLLGVGKGMYVLKLRDVGGKSYGVVSILKL